MNHEAFEKMDQSWIKGLKNVRDRQVPQQALRDFSESVEQRIFEKEKQRKRLIGVGVPAAALALALVFFAVSRFLFIPGVPPATEPVPTQESEIIAEVQILRELGAWTEEDDLAIGVSVETSFAELELMAPQFPL